MEAEINNRNLDKRIKNEKFELKFYKTVGIEQFRKLVFLLEKAIHFKDKGKNINYHIEGSNLRNAENFKKFLYYNGSIHVKNAIFLSLMIAVKFLFFGASLAFDIILLLDLIVDIYCVMLQRYNYIRINKLIRAEEESKKRKMEREVMRFEGQSVEKELILTDEQKKEDLDLIKKMQGYLSNLVDVSLDNNDIESLKRIRDFFEIYKQSKNNNEEKGNVKVL